jgi:hypothetical protein
MDFFTATVQIGGAVVALYFLLLMGRALSARAAGPHAELVLNQPLLTMLIPLPHWRKRDDVEESELDTGYTNTPEYAKVRESTPESTQEMLVVNDIGKPALLPRLTDEEAISLEEARRNAIVLLNKCVQYYQSDAAKLAGELDTGQIPRHDVIHMGSKQRKQIVDDLWESGFCSKGNTGTYILSEVSASCGELLQHIIKRDPKYRVYPLGYSRRKKSIMDDAVNALPGLTR